MDAAIGGKTGVNLPEGKNLVGAFWQPAAVLCDTEALATLPAREWASGRGEMAKYAFLAGSRRRRPDASLLELPSTSRWPAAWPSRRRWWRPTSGRADRRMVLNYGHTLAHALEAAAFEPDARSDLRHGEAVAVGLVFAALLARRLGRIDDERVALHRRVVGGFDLSRRPPGRRRPRRARGVHGPGQEGPTTTSPSSSTAPTGSSRSAASTRPTCVATLAEMGGP